MLHLICPSSIENVVFISTLSIHFTSFTSPDYPANPRFQTKTSRIDRACLTCYLRSTLFFNHRHRCCSTTIYHTRARARFLLYDSRTISGTLYSNAAPFFFLVSHFWFVFIHLGCYPAKLRVSKNKRHHSHKNKEGFETRGKKTRPPGLSLHCLVCVCLI